MEDHSPQSHREHGGFLGYTKIFLCDLCVSYVAIFLCGSVANFSVASR